MGEQLSGVLLGGVLAVVGGFLAQWWAARERRAEAHRERLERYRQDVTRATVEAFEVIQRARPDALTIFGSNDDIQERMRELNTREPEVGQLLLAVAIGRPGADAQAVADAAEELRTRLRATAGKSLHYARTVVSGRGENSYDEAQKSNFEAREQLDRLKQALRDL